MKEEIRQDVESEEDRVEEVESLKVKTNVKAGGDPETPGVVSEIPIIPPG